MKSMILGLKNNLKYNFLTFFSNNADAFFQITVKGKVLLPMIIGMILSTVDVMAQNPFGNGLQDASSMGNLVIKVLLWTFPFLGFIAGFLAIIKWRKKEETWWRELIVAVVFFGGWGFLFASAWDVGHNKNDVSLEDFNVNQ